MLVFGSIPALKIDLLINNASAERPNSGYHWISTSSCKTGEERKSLRCHRISPTSEEEALKHTPWY